MGSIEQMSEGIEIRIGRILKLNNNIFEMDVVPNDGDKDYSITMETQHIEEVMDRINYLLIENEVYY
jgi:hypothetical protein